MQKKYLALLSFAVLMLPACDAIESEQQLELNTPSVILVGMPIRELDYQLGIQE